MRHLGKGYGMPSSHAQFCGYFAASVVLFLLFRHSPSAKARIANTRHTTGRQTVDVVVSGQSADADKEPPLSQVYTLQLHHPRLTHTLLCAVAVTSAVVMAISRVYLYYHTPKQVIVGTSVGVAFAIFWFAITEVARRVGLIDWILQLDIVRMARIRDLICEEDLVEIGWQVSERRRRRLTATSKKSM